MSDFEKRLNRKRFVRLTITTALVIIILNILRANGYWFDTRSYLVEAEVPEIFGSIWFNLLTAVLPGIAMFVYEKWDYSPRNFVILFVVSLMTPLSLGIGLFLTIVSFFVTITIVGILGTIFSIIVNIWKVVPKGTKDHAARLIQKGWEFIYPEK